MKKYSLSIQASLACTASPQPWTPKSFPNHFPLYVDHEHLPSERNSHGKISQEKKRIALEIDWNFRCCDACLLSLVMQWCEYFVMQFFTEKDEICN